MPGRRHSAYAYARPAFDALHHFELATLLDAHAVARVVSAATRDLQAVHTLLAEMDLAIRGHTLGAWSERELQLHRALNEQSGNLVLATMAERAMREALGTAAPVRTLEAISRLHAQHHQILRCIEDGQADQAVEHTRAHMATLRDLAVVQQVRLRP